MMNEYELIFTLAGIVQWWEDLPSNLRQDIEGSGAEPGYIAKARRLVDYYSKRQPRINLHSMVPDRRRMRTDQLVSQIMHLIDDCLCEHGECRGHKQAARALSAAFFDSGVEVITDQDRAEAGLPPRNWNGLTASELAAIEHRRLELMMAPITVANPSAPLTESGADPTKVLS